MSSRQCDPRDGPYRPSRQRCRVDMAGASGPTLPLGEAFPVACPPGHGLPAGRTLELCAYPAAAVPVGSALRCDLWGCVGWGGLCPRMAARRGLRDGSTDATERCGAARSGSARHRCAHAVLHERSVPRVSTGLAPCLRQGAPTATPRASRPLSPTTAPAATWVGVCPRCADASPWPYRAGGQPSGLRCSASEGREAALMAHQRNHEHPRW
jgi:hypothetical protein